MQTTVSLDIREDVATLTFSCDEPGKPNTLDYQVLDELDQHLDALYENITQLRAVIIESAQPRYFIVGANINVLKTLDDTSIVPWVKTGHRIFNRLEALPLPVIARVQGFALGGGLELAMACDLIVADDTAKFGQPEAGLGVVSGWGGSYRLPRRVGLAKAKEMFFTAQIVDAKTAYQMGVVDYVGKAAEVKEHIEELLSGIRKCGWLAVSKMKQLINHSPVIDIW
ncbi:MAG: enoyl-CoA hydratase/isomerase family protein, partial [Anaerolineae bacterium]|nr:enoyl-CoA hydratase/isomerase family protein [Anaerolineae bacterium]